jgi:hypothetical protein
LPNIPLARLCAPEGFERSAVARMHRRHPSGPDATALIGASLILLSFLLVLLECDPRSIPIEPFRDRAAAQKKMPRQHKRRRFAACIKQRNADASSRAANMKPSRALLQAAKQHDLDRTRRSRISFSGKLFSHVASRAAA